jgi:hypothetical protein
MANINNVGVGRKCLKRGRAIERVRYKAIRATALANTDFTPTSARHKNERE